MSARATRGAGEGQPEYQNRRGTAINKNKHAGSQGEAQSKETGDEGTKNVSVALPHCPFCNVSVTSDEGETWMSGAIQNHLRQMHLKETQTRLEGDGEFGAGQTGLGLRELMKPIEFSSQVLEVQRTFTCPYWPEGVGKCSRWQKEMKKRTHLRKCSPGKSVADMYN